MMAHGIESVEPAQRIAISGRDWQSWLHNFCSNDIRSLKPGSGCEAFVLNVKGRTLCHAIVLCLETSGELLTTGIPSLSLIEHFDRYIITEDVRLVDKSSESGLWWTDDPGSELQNEFPETWSHAEIASGVRIIRSRIGNSPDLLFSLEKSAEPALVAWCNARGISRSRENSFHSARIRGCWPLNSVDLRDTNFPQEFDRDSRAISFQKGCYLGQETVARIDALGHVNQRLVSLKLRGEAGVEPGAKLIVREFPEKPVGNLTSVCSTGVKEWVALGFVRQTILNESPLPLLTLEGANNVAVEISRAASS